MSEKHTGWESDLFSCWRYNSVAQRRDGGFVAALGGVKDVSFISRVDEPMSEGWLHIIGPEASNTKRQLVRKYGCENM